MLNDGNGLLNVKMHAQAGLRTAQLDSKTTDLDLLILAAEDFDVSIRDGK